MTYKYTHFFPLDLILIELSGDFMKLTSVLSIRTPELFPAAL